MQLSSEDFFVLIQKSNERYRDTLEKIIYNYGGQNSTQASTMDSPDIPNSTIPARQPMEVHMTDEIYSVLFLASKRIENAISSRTIGSDEISHCAYIAAVQIRALAQQENESTSDTGQNTKASSYRRRPPPGGVTKPASGKKRGRPPRTRQSSREHDESDVGLQTVSQSTWSSIRKHEGS